jgi:hypothetical protein
MVTPQPADADPKRVGDEMRLLYSTAVSEIAGFKQQQWHITNYGLLLYAAVSSAPKLLGGSLTNVEYLVLAVVALAVLISGWILIGMFDGSIRVRRERLTHIRTHHLTDEFRVAWRAGKSREAMPDLPSEKVSLLPFFRSVFAIGFAATLWFLLRSFCAS